MQLPEPDLLVPLADGRRMAVDVRGDPAGDPVLYLHGTPDSRLARHPDDGIARRLGLRLICPDRPGIGGSDPDPAATPVSVAADLSAVLDALGAGRVGVATWSAGSVFGLALAGEAPSRVHSLVLAAPLIPADAYDTPGVLTGSDDGRRLFAEHLGSLSPGDLGRELAAWLVPTAIDGQLARTMLARTLTEVRDIPAAGAQLVLALQASVHRGLVGIEREIAAQATPLGPLLDAISARVHVTGGTEDAVTPPAMAHWIAARLGTRADLVTGAGHAVALLGWEALLTRAAPAARPGQPAPVEAPGTSGSSQETDGTSDQRRSNS